MSDTSKFLAAINIHDKRLKLKRRRKADQRLRLKMADRYIKEGKTTPDGVDK